MLPITAGTSSHCQDIGVTILCFSLRCKMLEALCSFLHTASQANFPYDVEKKSSAVVLLTFPTLTKLLVHHGAT